MAGSATIRIMSAEEIVALGGGEVPYFRWPEIGTLFAERQMRLTQHHTRGHALADYLRLLAAIAKSQQRLIKAGGPRVLPDIQSLLEARESGQAPLAPDRMVRTDWWRDVLRAIIDDVMETAPAATQELLAALRKMPDEALEQRADAVLSGRVPADQIGVAPLVGAALQVYWSHALSTLQSLEASQDRPWFSREFIAPGCPACGSAPIASITRTMAGTAGHRYLSCSLCAGEWHRTRTDCTRCGSSKSLAYQSLEMADDAADSVAGEDGSTAEDSSRAALATIQAETCDDCNHYLKIMHTDRDPMLEVTADDLASLTLDLLLSETGRQAHGHNLMLVFADTSG